MLLHKPQVYRHLLFNRIPYIEKGFDVNVWKLTLLLTLFDIYIKWFRMEKVARNFVSNSNDGSGINNSTIGMSNNGIGFNSVNISWLDNPSTSFWIKYLYLLFLCVMESVIFHLTVRLFVACLPRARSTAILKYNYVSMALVISGFGRLLVLLMVIWDYNELEYSWLISIFVFTSNMEAVAGKIHVINDES